MKQKNCNPSVTKFLDEKNHPNRELIETLRNLILSTNQSLDENIKWNGPNYSINGEDRITMRLFPPKSFQLIFHCGAKARNDLKERLIIVKSDLLLWKSNDRALIELKKLESEDFNQKELIGIIKKWLKASS